MKRKRSVKRTPWVEDLEDQDPVVPVLPEPDFIDTRPGVTEGATAWGAEPRGDLNPVEDVLDRVLGRFAGTPRSTLQEITTIWEAVTGPSWAGTTPVRITEGTLVVEVPDGITASRLQFDSSQVIRALRDVAGGQVRTVRFRVARR